MSPVADSHPFRPTSLALALDAEAEIEVVGEASTSRDALARLPAVHPDVVLAGSRLRDPDAVELCRLPREATPGTHVLVLDVDEDQKLVASAITAGASGLVPDTSDEQDLVEAIEDGGRHVSQAEADDRPQAEGPSQSACFA